MWACAVGNVLDTNGRAHIHSCYLPRSQVKLPSYEPPAIIKRSNAIRLHKPDDCVEDGVVGTVGTVGTAGSSVGATPKPIRATSLDDYAVHTATFERPELSDFALNDGVNKFKATLDTIKFQDQRSQWFAINTLATSAALHAERITRHVADLKARIIALNRARLLERLQ